MNKQPPRTTHLWRVLTPLALVFATACGDDPPADSAEDSAPQCNEWSAMQDFVFASTNWRERCNPDVAQYRASYLKTDHVFTACYGADPCMLRECVGSLDADTSCEWPTICDEARNMEEVYCE